MFKKASKIKLRFDTPMGKLSTEDLWDLPLTTLNDIAKGLRAGLKVSEEEDFINLKVKPDPKLALRFDIVKDIITSKLDDQAQKEKASDIRIKRQQILGLKAQKENEAMSNLSIAELNEQLAELDKAEE